MKIRLLIATGDSGYAEHLSRVLADKYAGIFEVGVCSAVERLAGLLTNNKYDAALIEPSFAGSADLGSIRLPLLLCDESPLHARNAENVGKVKKYQRISNIAGIVLESYAELGTGAYGFSENRAHITAVWSPCGGTGKTTVALAYAARKVAAGKQTTYLDLEDFSSTSAYFVEHGKSISTVFEKLEADVPMMLLGIRQRDSGTGITYFCGPDNYDDMNILTADDLAVLIQSCAMNADEVVVDLSSRCDEKTWKIFDLAATVLLVCDPSSTSQVKLNQFMKQHNIAQGIQNKSVLISNKGARVKLESINRVVNLPMVQSSDAVAIYKTLSGNAFEW